MITRIARILEGVPGEAVRIQLDMTTEQMMKRPETLTVREDGVLSVWAGDHALRAHLDMKRPLQDPLELLIELPGSIRLVEGDRIILAGPDTASEDMGGSGDTTGI